MYQLFIKYSNQNKLFTPVENILLGVSGGVDSMVLCDLFVKSGFKFAIAHCNFRLRGNEADGDERLVTNYARQHNIPFHVIRFDTEDYARSNSLSIQMAARELRYNWFAELMSVNNYQKIAVAHHADDSIETFFVNLTRGSGINGLCGIPITNQAIIRPLLFASRQQIMDYAQSNNIDYRNDSSNAIDKYTRNRIRLNIIPQFETINPNFKQTMLNNMRYLQEIQQFVSAEMDKTAKKICIKKSGNQYFDISKLEQLPYLNLFLYHALQPYGFKNESIDQIAASLNATSGKQFRSHTHLLVKDRDYLIVSPYLSEDEIVHYSIENETDEITKPLHLSFKTIEKTPQFQPVKTITTAQFDFDKLKFPLTLRKWQHGDSFVPFGMKGHKKLSDYFSDNKYSLLDKQNQWLLTSDNEIVWVVGKRIDDRFAIDQTTTTIWQADLIK